jgi:hypothetical protein
MKFLNVRSFKISAAIFSSLVLTASLGFGVPTPAPVTVQIVPFPNYGTISPNYNGQTLTNGKAYTMNASAKSGFTFTGWSSTNATVINYTNSKAKLTFTNGVTFTNDVTFTAYFVDKQKPTVSIQAPANSTALTNPAIYVTGTAKDNDAVANVFYHLVNQDGSTSSTASTGNAWNNWWVNLTLAANTNTLLVYAVDRSGNYSTTNQLKMTYSAAPASVSGTTIIVANPGSIYTASFASNTFSEDSSVGSYTYKKTGPVAGKLQLKYAAPPTALGSDTATLTFTDATSGIFTNGDGVGGNFSLSTANNQALAAVTGADILLTDANGTNETLLSFLTPPNIVDNGHLFQVSQTLTIWLSAAYPGETGNRVSVVFTHQQRANGIFGTVAPVISTGTVIGTGMVGTTNTVTISFDKFNFNPNNNNQYAPTVGNNLNILTCYYTDTSPTNGTATFIYTNYSPVGSLLRLGVNGTGQTNYYILTFTNAAATNSLDAGTFYAETYDAYGLFQGTHAGFFAIAAPPVITTQPSPQAVTNNGTASFSVIATGSQPLTYQWQLNGTALTDGTSGWGSTIAGSTTTNLTISAAATNDIGNYSVVVANGFGSVTSSVAALAVTLSPIITSQPQSQAVTNGLTARFNVTATGAPTLTYQWVFNGTNMTDGTPVWSSSLINGSLTPNLNITAVTTNDMGNYQVIISNSFGSVTSAPPARLTIVP